MAKKRKLIEWFLHSENETSAMGLTVFIDGAVRMSRCFERGEFQISESDKRALKHFVLKEQGFLSIDNERLGQEIEREAEKRRREAETSGLEFMAAPQMDAGMSVFRSDVGSAPHEVNHYDLVGDAQKYPGAESLQRLRRIELRLLELAETLTAKPD